MSSSGFDPGPVPLAFPQAFQSQSKFPPAFHDPEPVQPDTPVQAGIKIRVSYCHSQRGQRGNLGHPWWGGYRICSQRHLLPRSSCHKILIVTECQHSLLPMLPSAQ
ncbi:hypothetical protein DPEC_G00343690 [Dallia pectoralis]|uniref:Uncharacterized protein n=1 Tax=Dallia pectoralis TaxID=75939 RepID=A0ACC2F370_DALPE|nr:hypothetical protein DPEC_G00343690 [Dallia pectoralis]